MTDTHEPTAAPAGDQELAAFPADAAAAAPAATTTTTTEPAPAAAAADGATEPAAAAATAATADGAKSEQSDNSMKTTQSFAALPRHLHALARQIRKLNPTDLAYVADVTASKAHKDVFSLMQYTGSSWYLPHIRPVEEGEPEWQLKYDLNVGLIVTLAGQRMELPLLSPLIRFALLVLVWFTLWNILPHNIIERKGVVFDPLILVVFSSIVGGFICRLLQIPPLVGVLWIAIMWHNIPELGYFTSGIEKHVRSISSKAGLTMILVRAGYSLTWTSLRPRWQRCLLLASLPMVLEGITHSFIANNLFEYHDNYNWAFLQGMTCSIVAPAIVVPGTLYLQELGYGKGAAPLALMMSSVGLEIVFGVWTVNFIANLMFNLNTSLAVAIVLGPIQFLVGILLGIFIGLLFYGLTEVLKREAKPLPTGKYATEHIHGVLDMGLVFFMCLAFTMIFLGYYLSLPAGGAVMVVFFSATVAHMWIKDGDKELEEQKKYFGFRLAQLWDLIIMPYLFAMVGADINLKAIFNSTFFPKAIVCVVVSGAVRIIVMFVIMTGSGFTFKEKVLVCIGYSGKATPQASMGSLSLNFVKADPTSPTYALDLARATNVKQVATLYVLVYAPLAAVGLVKGGKRVFKREPLLPTAAK